MTDSGGIKVRGTCPDGHTLTTTAPKGRVTWTGPCPTEGCGKKLTCRRIKTEQQSTTPTDDGKSGAPAGELVVKKAAYRDTPPEQAPQVDDEPTPEGDGDDDDAGGSPDADSIGGNPGVREDRRTPDDDTGSGADAGNDVRPAGERGRGGRFRRARGRRTYPGVPYGA